MTFEKRIRRQRRLQVLQLLAENSESSWNLFILRDAMADLRQKMTVSEMREIADWLAAEGLATLAARPQPAVLQATEHGISVAAGDIACEGVARPLP